MTIDKQVPANEDAAVTARSVRRLGLATPGDERLMRALPIEAPVSVEVCGIGYAVMMATPVDLDDYALGFALAEGLIDEASQLTKVEAHPVEGGWALRLWLPPERAALALDRARRRVGESSCGLCGIENIEEVLRPLPAVTARLAVSRDAIAERSTSIRAVSGGKGRSTSSIFSIPHRPQLLSLTRRRARSSASCARSGLSQRRSAQPPSIGWTLILLSWAGVSTSPSASAKPSA